MIETILWGVAGLGLVVVAWVALSRLLSEPPDMNHPD